MKIILETEKAECLENESIICPYCGKNNGKEEWEPVTYNTLVICEHCRKEFRLFHEVKIMHTTVPLGKKFNFDWNKKKEIEYTIDDCCSDCGSPDILKAMEETDYTLFEVVECNECGYLEVRNEKEKGWKV